MRSSYSSESVRLHDTSLEIAPVAWEGYSST
jgi:hypothetical protein